MGHRFYGGLAAALFGLFVVAGVRVFVLVRGDVGSTWTIVRYTLAGSILWTLAMFLIAMAVASLPDR